MDDPSRQLVSYRLCLCSRPPFRFAKVVFPIWQPFPEDNELGFVTVRELDDLACILRVRRVHDLVFERGVSLVRVHGGDELNKRETDSRSSSPA